MALCKICILSLFTLLINQLSILYKFLQRNSLQIFRFIIAGVIASIINFFVYRTLFFIFNNIVIASFCGYLVGLIVSFVFAKMWVFRTKSNQKLKKSFSIFCLIYFLGGIEMSFLIVFINQLTNDYRLAWFVGVFVAALNNYLGSKYFSFRS